MIKTIRSCLGKTVLGKIKRRILPADNIHIPRPWFPAHNKHLTKTLLITCSSGFNQDFPVASSLMRVGFARGWAEVCGPAKLIRDSDVIREIELYENPAVFMSEFEFANISYADGARSGRWLQ